MQASPVHINLSGFTACPPLIQFEPDDGTKSDESGKSQLSHIQALQLEKATDDWDVQEAKQ
jgi:hypothetical protein